MRDVTAMAEIVCARVEGRVLGEENLGQGFCERGAMAGRACTCSTTATNGMLDWRTSRLQRQGRWIRILAKRYAVSPKFHFYLPMGNRGRGKRRRPFEQNPMQR